MTDLLGLVDDLWEGRTDALEVNPMMGRGQIVSLSEGTAFLSWLANICMFATADGLVLVDTGNPFSAADTHTMVRSWSSEPLHTAVFSHGHIDHCFGVGPFEDEHGPVRVIGHEAMPARFDRYTLTAGWNSHINMRQFNVSSGLQWPTVYRYPDVTYSDSLSIDFGDDRVELRHARGETDDATWTWWPARGVLCPGDLIIWGTPNAGNPQKVQRYPREWAAALRDMATLDASVLLPGHGLPVVGAERVRAILTDTASYLESLHDQTVELMNTGARLDDIIHTVAPPAALAQKPYLRPIYDDPEFIVRNVWRYYGGWFDGNPASLKPAREAELAREICSLAGGAGALAERARALIGSDLRLATHLAELAWLADPATRDVREEVLLARAQAEPSLMAKGIFTSASRE